MATIGTASHSSYLNTPRRAYITTTTFQNDIFQYTTTTNPQTFEVTGTLTSLATVGTGTSATCPANRILVENGKKLYPSGLAISNNTTYGAPNPGVTTYMVGVYDPGSFLSGFIDPNSQVFAPYNTDKPNYVPRGVNPNGNTTIDQGPPVYTLGSVTAGTTVTAGTSITAGTNITATGVLTGTELVVQNARTLTQSTTTTLTADCSLASYFKIVINAANNFQLDASNVVDGQIVVIAINTSGNASTPTITLGDNIRGVSPAGTFAVTTLLTGTMTFIGVGTTLVELARVAAVTAA
jgi:hypothetical protein